MTVLYGIKNCDTVKKARKWLADSQVNYQFHDFREDGLSEQQVQQWLDELGWETLVNKRSTTWKTLDEATRNKLDNHSAIALIVSKPTLIKQPLLDTGKQRYIGFKSEQYQTLFN